MGIDFASPLNFLGDDYCAVLIEAKADGTFLVLGSIRGDDEILRARRLALALGVHVSQEGFTPTVNTKEER